MVSGIHNLRSLISGPVLSAYVDPESLAALIVWADGGRRKWWRKWRCPIVCVRTLCNGLLPCGSGGCKPDGKSGCCKSGGKSGGKSGKSGGKSGRCRAVTLAPLLMVLLL